MYSAKNDANSLLNGRKPSGGYLNPPLNPKNGRILKVLAICRISTLNQDEQSLADQEAMYRKWVGEHFVGEVEFQVIATQASGERLDRAEIAQAKDLIATRKIDLVIAEDLARIMRDMDAVKFCGFAQDFDTRLIAINDYIDTGQDGWKDRAFMSSWSHGKNNEDTSRRIKRSLANRFVAEGKVFPCEIYGYIKPTDCEGEDDVHIDPAASPVFDKWFAMLEAGASFTEIADCLNQQGIPVGPYCREKQWTGTMVGRITRNPILKGLRQRNRFHSRKHNASGHRKSVRAPESELKTRFCPHLVHINPARYDHVIEMLRQRNACFRRKTIDGVDPLLHRPKKRSRWPGQHCYCGVCGRMLVYGAHGQNDHLVCSGTAAYKCWVGVSFDAILGAQKLLQAVVATVESLPEFGKTFTEMLERESQNAVGDLAKNLDNLNMQIGKLQREQNNLLAAIREGSPAAALVGELKRIEGEALGLHRERDQLAKEQPVRS